MESIPECDAALGSANQALGLRIGALFGILCTSALGVAVPFVCRVADLAAISYVRAFAGGVVLATGARSICDAQYGLRQTSEHAFVFKVPRCTCPWLQMLSALRLLSVAAVPAPSNPMTLLHTVTSLCRLCAHPGRRH